MAKIKLKHSSTALAGLLLIALLLPYSYAFAGNPPGGPAGVGAANVWYVPEGSTGRDSDGFFETFVLVANPGEEEAYVWLRHQLEQPCPVTGGDWPGSEMVVPPKSRTTIKLAESLGPGAPGAGYVWSVSTKVFSDVPVVVERSMFWSSYEYGRRTATAARGITEPASTWYFAEGSTHSGGNAFETWILVQNPFKDISNVEIYYQTPEGEIDGPAFALTPHTRRSINVADTVPSNHSVSTRVVADRPVLAERSVYINRPEYTATSGYVYPESRRVEGHASVGITEPSDVWYIPYGNISPSLYSRYDTYILFQNPGSESAEVEVTYYDFGEDVEVLHEEPFILPAHTRFSRWPRGLNEYPDTQGFSAIVNSSEPIVVEKVRYYRTIDRFQRKPDYYDWASGSPGLSETATRWFFAEGSTAGEFMTWVAVFNPTGETAEVSFLFQTPSGERKGLVITVEPYGRSGVTVDETVPDEWSVSTTVVSDKPIVAERGMYLSPGSTTSEVGIPGD